MDPKTAYLTRTDADIYFLGVLETDSWDSATDANKDKALIEGATIIDRLNYLSEKTVDTQEHAFPRKILDRNGVIITTVPTDILYANCEMALALLDGWDIQAEVETVRSVAAGYSTAKMTYDSSSVPLNQRLGIPWRAWQFLTAYLRDPRSLRLVRV